MEAEGEHPPDAVDGSSVPPRTLSIRELFSAALAEKSDEAAGEGLVLVAQGVFASAPGGVEDADTLIARLSEVLIDEAPKDAEMARLRQMQDTYHMGRLGYACACCWTAALFARTELCLRARSRLTSRLLHMGRPRLAALQEACARLVAEPLPSLLAQLAATKTKCIDRLQREVALQAVSVRSAKAVASVTPLLTVSSCSELTLGRANLAKTDTISQTKSSE